MKKFVLLFVIAVLGLVGFSGYNRVAQMTGSPALAVDPINVVSVQPRTSLFILQEVLAGKVGTGIMVDPTQKLLTFYKTYSNGTAGFVTLDVSKTQPMQYFWETCGGKGNACSYSTFKELSDFMKGQGWKNVPLSDLPKYAPLVAEATAMYLTSLFGAIMPSFFIFPITPDFENVILGEPIIG